MAVTAETADGGGAARLGFTVGMVVQEFGWDSDVDQSLREAIEDQIEADLLDEDADEVVDGVIAWWRDGDGDLADMLVDTLGTLAEGGAVWLLAPKAGREGHIDAAEVEEAAPGVGLHLTQTINVCADWSAYRLVASKGGRTTQQGDRSSKGDTRLA